MRSKYFTISLWIPLAILAGFIIHTVSSPSKTFASSVTPMSITVDGKTIPLKSQTIMANPGQTFIIDIMTSNLMNQPCPLTVTGSVFPGTTLQYNSLTKVSIAYFNPQLIIHSADCSTDPSHVVFGCGATPKLENGSSPVILYPGMSKRFRFSVKVPTTKWQCTAHTALSLNFAGRPLGHWPNSCKKEFRSLQGSLELRFVPATPCVK